MTILRRILRRIALRLVNMRLGQRLLLLIVLAAAIIAGVISVVSRVTNLPTPELPFLAIRPGSGASERAIQLVIQRGNFEQEQAILRRDSTIMRDTSTDHYFQEIVQANQGLLAAGATRIQLVDLEWGPISVNGNQAKATTTETWLTEFANGTSETSQALNVYTLVQQDGSWRIQSDDQTETSVSTPRVF